ncbi:MAG TPA: hypothetical protein VK459_18995 [Polyangiaceae bacterium]|nr:hypothetical protein [Polyangiaceae bacterium]
MDGGAPPADGGAPPADSGSPEGGAADPGAAPSAPTASAPTASAGDPAAPVAEGSPGSGRILDPKKIYVSIPVALGVSASVNFAMGIAFTVLSNAKVAKTEGVWRELRTDGGPGACTKPAFAARCDELYGADSDRQTYRDMAVVSYLGAVGFGLGAGVSYFLLFKGSEGNGSAGGASALVVDIGPSGGGAAIKGTF